MDWLLFAIFLAACCAAGTTGAMFPPGDWYNTLEKPSWTPPNWVFPVTWTTLYLLMSFAGARVAAAEENGVAMSLWSLQIALNTLWTPIFFGLRRLKGAILVIAGLWLSVLGCVWAFWQVDTLATLAFLPYLLWVSIAACLNISVWRKNPNVEPVMLASSGV